MDTESKAVLEKIFDVLGFSDEERKDTILDFQKKLAAELLRSVQSELSAEHQEFLQREGATMSDPNNPTVIEIKAEVQKLHPLEEYQARMKKILKTLLPPYATYLSDGLSSENSERIRALAFDYAARP